MTISNLLKGHEKDLGGGFVVRRYLPSSVKQAVGPFIFFDMMCVRTRTSALPP